MVSSTVLYCTVPDPSLVCFLWQIHPLIGLGILFLVLWCLETAGSVLSLAWLVHLALLILPITTHENNLDNLHNLLHRPPLLGILALTLTFAILTSSAHLLLGSNAPWPNQWKTFHPEDAVWLTVGEDDAVPVQIVSPLDHCLLHSHLDVLHDRVQHQLLEDVHHQKISSWKHVS